MSADRGLPVATFFAAEPVAAGATVSLDEDAAHHARVRRLDVGHRIRLLDGGGSIGHGTLVRLAKAHMQVEVATVERVEPPPEVHMLVPVADRERMLLLAEKCAELGAASWRPVLWRRSRSVSPRGEGMTFHAKVRARMIGALEQSGNPWLPALYPESTVERAIAAAPRGARVVLDASGDSMVGTEMIAPLCVAVGPEGGIEPDERDLLLTAGWLPVAVGRTTLRFETAAIAALAIARAALDRTSEPTIG
ncbi:MAG: 16S rRNA (uracil(1498)-N(3))-methyltransferase [Gemmatimonadaceae bacterium]|nr:16S rRNA (uracil(1498)-N(3))-methyltransferase [Gemmatimonadaceae bacterium]